MILRNNEKKIVKAAEHREHFAIRKLTVGAVSVLLGTSLWLGTNNNVAKADTEGNQDTNSDANIVSESQTAVNTDKINKVVVQNNITAPSTNENNQSSNITIDADKATNKNEVENKLQSSAQIKDTDQKDVAISKQVVTSENKAQDQTTSITEANNESTNKPTAVTEPAKEENTETVTDTQEEHNIIVTGIDDITGQTLSGSTSFKAKTGDSSHKIYTGYVGYKLMNPEVLEGYQVKYPAYGHVNLVVPDHDVDLTLHFLPLAPTTVEYVDTDGNLLTKFSDSSEASTSKSPYSDQDGIENSKFSARAIDIPGYELISDPVIEKPITQVSTKDNLNPMILKFVYKKIAPTADKGLPNGGGAGITGIGEDYGINWSHLPGGVNIDLIKDNYGEDNYESIIKNMQDRYTKQGFSYIGVKNDHKDSDKTNRLESYIAVHFLPHKAVNVNYVDENGNKLSDAVVLSFNKENPDQMNNGIDPKNNWYPNGEWKSEPKDISGYKLDKVLGATEGKFTTFNYTVTYVYTKATSGKVLYIDETDDKTLQSDDINGNIGDNVNYNANPSIENYQKQGYVLVNNDLATGNKIFDADTNNNIFKIVFKHGIDTKTSSKDGSQVIHYVYEDGEKAADDNLQITTFTQTIKTDAVTGKVIDSSWTPESHTFNKVKSPTIDGYHADKINVDGETVTPDKPVIEVTVTYTKNGTKVENIDNKQSTQTVKFVDEEGHELAKEVISPVFNYEYSGDTYDAYTNELIKQGSWNVDSHTFDTIAVPVINGYVAVDGFSKKNNQIIAGGLTSTRNNLNVIAEVIYKKVGKIIPVDPDGKLIPDAPTPSYKNDPINPTKVIPDEPVPTIPDYKPNTPSVTPVDPTKDTPVPYTKNPEVINGKVIYIDDTTDETLKTDELRGSIGKKIDYTTKEIITKFENKGYVLVSNDFKDGSEIFTKGDNEFKVHFKHGTTTVTPDKPGKPGEPINPNDPDGPKWP
ncbi:YSIRK-type signal peptide-containing protein, partial [Lactobacillus acidophilus]